MSDRPPLRVLVVEDSPDDAELLVRSLARHYSVQHERVETEPAMRAALVSEWDVVISDFSMPAFSALGAIEVAKEVNPDLPILIVSGTIGEETAVSALQAGADDFLLKGKFARLIPAIERVKRERHARAAKRAAERAQRSADERYRLLIETTNEGVWMVDDTATITYVNKRMAQLLGYEQHELLGRAALDVVRSDLREQLEAIMARPNGQKVDQLEVALRRKDGGDLWVLVDSNPVTDSEGRVGAMGMAMDITLRKRLEDQLRQAQKMEAIGSLAGGIAHDFNNLLSVILSYSTFVLDELAPAEPIRADVQEIKRAGERATELTRQLLAFSRQQILQPRNLDLHQVVIGLEKMLRRVLGADLELSVLRSYPLGTIRADPGSMEQVIMNLIVNARDAMPRGGKVTIEVANAELDEEYADTHHEVKPGRYVLLAVTDTGAGMDAATRARVFEPFFTTKERGKGTGLGLSTVFGIVKQSAGHIWVYSEPGRGTTFKVYFPRVDGPADPLTQPAPKAANLRGTETVLLVEDEEQVRVMLRTSLRRFGYNVIDAQNGGEAITICEKFSAKIHLMVTDVVMPRMSGRELAERLASMRPQMKVLYLSGYTENSVVHHGVLDSGVAFLQKPVTPEQLARKVRELLDETRPKGGP